MSEEKQVEIKAIALELAGAMQQARDREVSGLFKEIKNEIKYLRTDLGKLESSITALEGAYNDEVRPNIKTWNSNADTSKWITRAVGGILIAAIMSLIIIQ
jgi:uncharacterized protein YicC (UPF0701 family)